MADNNTDTNTNIDKKALKKEEKARLKEEKKALKAENKSIRKLRFLLLRVWLFKNVFTIVVMFVVILMAFTVTGLIPQSLPVLGTYSYAMRDALQEFLEIGDDEFYSMFGSITGVFTLLWSIGYASSKIKRVSYYMLDRNKILKIVLQNSNLTLTDKGRIISIEKKIGIDLDGDHLVGDKEEIDNHDPDNLVNEIVQTFNELQTIMKVDRETLKKTLNETTTNPNIPPKNTEEEESSEDTSTTEETSEVQNDDIPEVVVKKPAIPYTRNKKF